MCSRRLELYDALRSAHGCSLCAVGLTGLMIWFKIGVFGFLPRWWIDIALAVHFYEAVLATLAIIVWHFYQVIFDPDVYPVNYAFIDGRVSEDSS